MKLFLIVFACLFALITWSNHSAKQAELVEKAAKAEAIALKPVVDPAILTTSPILKLAGFDIDHHCKHWAHSLDFEQCKTKELDAAYKIALMPKIPPGAPEFCIKINDTKSYFALMLCIEEKVIIKEGREQLVETKRVRDGTDIWGTPLKK